jgi:hypothetical protein
LNQSAGRLCIGEERHAETVKRWFLTPELLDEFVELTLVHDDRPSAGAESQNPNNATFERMCHASLRFIEPRCA